MLGIRSVPPNICSRRLRRGQLKRVPARGPLVGLFIGCPACGFVASYLAEEGSFVEASDDDGPILVGVDRPPPCLRCRRRIGIANGELAAS